MLLSEGQKTASSLSSSSVRQSTVHSFLLLRHFQLPHEALDRLFYDTSSVSFFFFHLSHSFYFFLMLTSSTNSPYQTCILVYCLVFITYWFKRDSLLSCKASQSGSCGANIMDGASGGGVSFSFLSGNFYLGEGLQRATLRSEDFLFMFLHSTGAV